LPPLFGAKLRKPISLSLSLNLFHFHFAISLSLISPPLESLSL
jgi:hypothetical protein